MDFQQTFNIITLATSAMVFVAMVFVGLIVYIFKVRGDLLSLATTLIVKAEDEWKDISKSGGYKFGYVCKTLYKRVPIWIRPFISYEDIQAMVQATFNELQRYSTMQLEQVIKKMERKHSTK